MPLHCYDIPGPVDNARTSYIFYGTPVNACPYDPNSIASLMWVAEWAHEDQEFMEAVLALISERGRVGS